jgi:hypothetical protein
MSEHEWADKYERAIAQFEKHLHRAEDGTLELDATDGPSIGIDDPVVFEDLFRSLQFTNKMVKSREIRPNEIAANTL